ncbi:MAG: hypothetical protein ACI35Q_00250, partial [Marinilabiliaceae bacterium]
MLGKQPFSFGKGTTITLISDKFIRFLDYQSGESLLAKIQRSKFITKVSHFAKSQRNKAHLR